MLSAYRDVFMDKAKLWALEWVGPEPLSTTPVGMPLLHASSVTPSETPPLPRVVKGIKRGASLSCQAHSRDLGMLPRPSIPFPPLKASATP